jgi:hypothetical protein
MFLPKSFISLFLAGAAISVPIPTPADTISSNLASPSGGVESATANNWLAASFTIGSSSTLQDVVLSLADTNASGGSAAVSIYDDDGLNEPGSLLATLTSVSTLTASLAPVTWTSSELSLSSNSTYWVVLSTLTGEVDWSYAGDDSGSGSGFTDTWAASYDGGGSWYVYASSQNAGVDPLQMSIETTSAGAAATPEPSTLALCSLFGVIAAVGGRKGFRQTNRRV